MKTKRRKQEGQAMIEFIVVSLVVFFFLLFFLSLSIVLVVSDYIDYATFMAARTFKAGLSVRDKQEERAREVFNAYASKISGIARNFRVEFLEDLPNRRQTAGVRVTYDMDLFYFPPVFIRDGNAPRSQITLQSETRLGREPTYDDCTSFFNRFDRRLGLNMGRLLSQMDDNGC